MVLVYCKQDPEFEPQTQDIKIKNKTKQPNNQAKKTMKHHSDEDPVAIQCWEGNRNCSMLLRQDIR